MFIETVFQSMNRGAFAGPLQPEYDEIAFHNVRSRPCLDLPGDEYSTRARLAQVWQYQKKAEASAFAGQKHNRGQNLFLRRSRVWWSNLFRVFRGLSPMIHPAPCTIGLDGLK